ncbi:MAG: FG-GAP-like repeat-containing protein [Candidatus Delongbacteria bacterium]|jgi:hypothetical protein|nr:FG-GAP-like repeat-containing protein [Candidatus Delongbacteria bacterium]
MKNIILLVIIFVSSFLQCQTFTDINAGLTGVTNSSVDGGDYDNDGDLDILLTGIYTDEFTHQITKIYNNSSGVFSDINADLDGVDNGTVAWGDYDNDGDLDFLLTGLYKSIIYRNDSGIFTDINAGLTVVVRGSSDWGDYDNDGDLDILLTGYIGSLKRISKIYRNDEGSFIDIGAGLTEVNESSVAWGDYDNDGDLDILLSGRSYDGPAYEISTIYRNDSGEFTDIGAGLTGVKESSVAWGDYDSDGDLDILLTGSDQDYNNIAIIYRNDSGIFSDIAAGLTGIRDGSAEWGDYDNDGDLDVLITGSQITKIYQNDSTIFTDIVADLSGISDGSAQWGDYDNDGDLDIISVGRGIFYGSYAANIYRNNCIVSNNIPSSPSNLLSLINGNEIVFSWDKSTDTETLQNGLSYNLYLGAESQTPTELSPMSIISSGYRKVVDLGNTGQNNSWTIKNLPSGSYYWSVQAVDNTYTGSSFSTEQFFEFTSPTTYPPVALPASNFNYYSFQANWSSENWAMGYYLDVATDSLFTNYVPGYQNKDVRDLLSYDITELEHNTTYYYRIRSYNGDLTASENSNIIIAETLYSQFSKIPSSFEEISDSSVEWGDFDNDGDLDLLLTGTPYANYYPITKIYRNDSHTFTDIEAGLTGVFSGSATWGDYDNDGDLDILLTGATGTPLDYNPISKIYRNDSGVFTDINAVLTPVTNSSVSWGDYDNDGDLDILLTGQYYYSDEDYMIVSKIYRNDSGVFINIAGLTGITGTGSWGDYDKDGDLDIILCGYDGSEEVTIIYRNDAGTFTEINAGLTGISSSSVAWGDYDNDGDLDLLITGATGTYPDYNPISKIYRNDSGAFTDINAGLIGVFNGSTKWGDYDNDGDLDVVLIGSSLESTSTSKVYRNDSGIFTDINAALTGIENSSVNWGDFDNDGDLDLITSGSSGWDSFTDLYLNNSFNSNTIPNPPTNLSTTNTDSTFTFHWAKAADNETPQNGLSYNLYIGTEPFSCNINTSMSDISNGYRKVVNIGNTGQNTSWTISNLPDGQYYWSVQAIDHAFAGSEFAEELFFTGINNILIPATTELFQNYPNPFNPETVIKYSLDKSSNVELRVFDIAGREVCSLISKKQDQGYHEVKFNADNLTSGMYFYRLKVNDMVIDCKKMMMIK